MYLYMAIPDLLHGPRVECRRVRWEDRVMWLRAGWRAFRLLAEQDAERMKNGH